MSPNAITQVGLAWMPSLCSTDTGSTSLRSPGVPSAFSLNFGTRNSEMPLVPCGASGSRASTRCTMFVGHVVVAPGDEDLLPGEQVAAVALPAPRGS